MSQDASHVILQKAKELKAIKERIDRGEELLKELKAERDKLELSVLPGLMENAEIESVKLEGIGTLYTVTKPKVSVLVADQPAFYSWLKENGHGDIIKETVHYQTLNSWAKEILEQGNPVPEWCKVFHETRAVIRRS